MYQTRNYSTFGPGVPFLWAHGVSQASPTLGAYGKNLADIGD
jgi:hypothetical protein